jgi:hypothetical protein
MGRRSRHARQAQYSSGTGADRIPPAKIETTRLSRFSLMEARMSGPGEIQVLERKSTALEALLYNFDVAKHNLKTEHEEWLKLTAATYLQQGGSLTLIGLASRTDTRAFNKQLSQFRINSVLNFLRKASPNNFKVAFQSAVGEGLAEADGMRDGMENKWYRGVILAAWMKPTPPPPPPVPPPAPPEPMVKRRIKVLFLVEAGMTGDTGGDPKGAQFMGNKAVDVVNDKLHQFLMVDAKTALVPASHVVRKIFLFPSTKGSTHYGVVQVNMLSCTVLYEWGRRYAPYCVLINNMNKLGAFQNEDPFINLLNDAQADQFVKDPYVAYDNLVNDWDLRRYSYADYAQGKF